MQYTRYLLLSIVVCSPGLYAESIGPKKQHPPYDFRNYHQDTDSYEQAIKSVNAIRNLDELIKNGIPMSAGFVYRQILQMLYRDCLIRQGKAYKKLSPALSHSKKINVLIKAATQEKNDANGINNQLLRAINKGLFDTKIKSNTLEVFKKLLQNDTPQYEECIKCINSINQDSTTEEIRGTWLKSDDPEKQLMVASEWQTSQGGWW